MIYLFHVICGHTRKIFYDFSIDNDFSSSYNNYGGILDEKNK